MFHLKIAQFLSEIWQKKKRNHGNAFSMLMNEAFEKKKNHFRKHLNISCCVPSCLISTKEQKLRGMKEDGKLKSNRQRNRMILYNCVYMYVHNHFDENLIGTKEFNETIQSLSSIVYVYDR